MLKINIKLILLSSVLFFQIQSSAFSMEKNEEINNKPSITIKQKNKNLIVEVPVGSIISFAGDKEPEGWLMCDGKRYSSLQYYKLYELIKEKYVPKEEDWIIKANKNSTVEKFFHVPDLRGRVLVGVDNGSNRVTSKNTLGESGGEEKNTLRSDELPPISIKIGNRHYSGIGDGYGLIGLQANEVNPPEHCYNIGQGKSHNNMPPYLVSNYIIKAEHIYENPQQEKNISQVINKLEKQIEELKISQRGYAKAWVNFNNDGTINNSYNVTSVTLNQTPYGGGDYTVNFTNPFSSTKYCCVGTAATSSYAILTVFQDPNTITTSSARFIIVNNLFLKAPSAFVNIVAFGD